MYGGPGRQPHNHTDSGQGKFERHKWAGNCKRKIASIASTIEKEDEIVCVCEREREGERNSDKSSDAPAG